MIELYQGDCLDVLTRLEASQYQCIFADPPYNTKRSKNIIDTYDQSELFKAKSWQNFHSSWDTMTDLEYLAWCKEWLSKCFNLLKSNGTIWICGSRHNIPFVSIALDQCDFETIQWVSWCIPNAMPHLAGKQMACSNQILIWARKRDKKHFYNHAKAKELNNGKNLRDYWLINNDSVAGRSWKHPSKKPPALVRQALAISTQTGDKVLDPFAGSGTTGLASYELGLGCVLIERDETYCSMIRERLHLTT